jgi:Na+-translocating ferredoxin:NAD+ oxidoreductase RnfD subunit
MIAAYLACLPAKAAGVFFVWYAAQLKLIQGVIAAEAAYSTGHFLVSYLVLSLGFQLKGKALALTALLISTAIPWLYRLGLWQLARTAS